MSLSSFRSFVPIWHHRAPNHQSLGLFDVTQRMRLPPPLKCSAAEPDQETKVFLFLWLGWWRMAWLRRLVCNWPQIRCCLLGLAGPDPSS
ncbi:hypothetical protein HN51_016962 [Arachis hypogaea]